MISSPSKWSTPKARIKGAIGRQSSQLDQRTLFLSTLSQRPAAMTLRRHESRYGASVLCEPRPMLSGELHQRPRVCFQRQTYLPLTNTRTHAAPPTTAPPTTARRVVRRATPATLTGVSGRPTRACAASTENERPSLLDHSTEPATPHATTAATNNARFTLMFFIVITSWLNQLRP